MGKKELRLVYDSEGDVLDVSVGEPREAVSREVDDDFFIRLDPKSEEVIGFSILNFEKWFQKKNEPKIIPLEGEFHIRAS